MMDSKEAVDLLKRCWEHRFNLEDYECDELVELIQQQDKMLELAIKKIIDYIIIPVPRGDGLCPFSIGLTQNCFDECNDQFADCWRKYLQSEVGK
jgi:hypothetical protein